MVEPLSSLESMVAAALADDEQRRTSEGIRDLIGDLRHVPMYKAITDEDAEELAKRFEERVSITQYIGAVLAERGYRPWLDAAKATIEPYYWDRYRRHLIQEGFPTSVVTTLG